jgi:hypothetical protein
LPTGIQSAGKQNEVECDNTNELSDVDIIKINTTDPFGASEYPTIKNKMRVGTPKRLEVLPATILMSKRSEPTNNIFSGDRFISIFFKICNGEPPSLSDHGN